MSIIKDIHRVISAVEDLQEQLSREDAKRTQAEIEASNNAAEAEQARRERDAADLRAEDMARRMIEVVDVIKAIRAENPGQRWSNTLEHRMLAVFDSATHAQLVASNTLHQRSASLDQSPGQPPQESEGGK